METLEALTFLKENLLSLTAILMTMVFIYHYVIEKEHGVKLTKKYRDNIFESQSKIFLNATQYLISGNKDLAIKEFLNAVELNRETIDTYFALGRLFRSNGEIEKAISIHRSLVVRENINESTRLLALKELAIDFDKGGFLDKAIETYKDVLKINRDQYEVILALCRIYEDIEDWDMAYSYRIMLSKVSPEGQAETISHILVEKGKVFFERKMYKEATEAVDDAFKFAPSVSARILKMKLFLIAGELESAKSMLLELINQDPMYTSFVFESLEESKAFKENGQYQNLISQLKNYFLSVQNDELAVSPSIVLSQIRVLSKQGKSQEAYAVLTEWMKNNPDQGDILKIEYINLLIEVGQRELAIEQVKDFLGHLNKSFTKHFCSQCGYNSDSIFWRCPQCHKWETIQFRWKV